MIKFDFSARSHSLESLKNDLNEKLGLLNVNHFSRIFHLDISNNNLTSIRGIPKYFPNLKELDVRFNDDLLDDERFPLDLAEFKHLHTLRVIIKELSFITLQRILQCTNLTYINGFEIKNLKASKIYLNECMEMLLSYYTNLESILKDHTKDLKILDEFDNTYQLIAQRCEGDFKHFEMGKHREILVFGKFQIYHNFAICLSKSSGEKDKNNERKRLVKNLKMLLKPQEQILEQFLSSSKFYTMERYKDNDRQKVFKLYKNTLSTYTFDFETKTKSFRRMKGDKNRKQFDIGQTASSKVFGKSLHVGMKPIKKKTINEKVIDVLKVIFPPLEWLPKYKWMKWLWKDIIAGITIGITCVPQSISCALIAGLPPIMGLYTSLFPIIGYFFFGTSKVASVGASALQALLVASTMEENHIEDPQDQMAIAMILAIFCGIIQLFFGVFRLGFLVNFLSESIISGFVSASAIVIILSQVGNFLGINTKGNSHMIHDVVYDTIMALPQLIYSWPTLLFGLICVGVVFTVIKGKIPIVTKKKTVKLPCFKRKFLLKKCTFVLRYIPWRILIVFASIIVLSILRYVFPQYSSEREVLRIRILGELEGGFPVPVIPFLQGSLNKVVLNFQLILTLILDSFAIVLVGFVEHYSIAKLCAGSNKPHYEINSSQEMLGIGFASLLGGFFHSFPCSGNLGRTALAQIAGAKSLFYSFVVFLVVLLTASFLTFVFYNLPLTLLAAMIIMTSSTLVDIKSILFTFRTKKSDFFLLLISFFITIFWGAIEGILISVLLSVLIWGQYFSRPKMHRLGRIPGTNEYRSVVLWPEAVETDGILNLRFDYGIYFANIQFFRDYVMKHLHDYEKDCYVLILSFSSVSFIDSMGLKGLKDIIKITQKKNIQLFFAHVNYNVYSSLEVCGLVQKIGTDCFFLDEHSAQIKAINIVKMKLQNERSLILKARTKRFKSMTDVRNILKKFEKDEFFDDLAMKKKKTMKQKLPKLYPSRSYNNIRYDPTVNVFTDAHTPFATALTPMKDNQDKYSSGFVKTHGSKKTNILHDQKNFQIDLEMIDDDDDDDSEYEYKLDSKNFESEVDSDSDSDV